MGVENLSRNRIRSWDCPAHSESLYWLCYPSPPSVCNYFYGVWFLRFLFLFYFYFIVLCSVKIYQNKMCTNQKQWKCHALRYKVCFISQDFLVVNIYFISFIQIWVKGYLFWWKENIYLCHTENLLQYYDLLGVSVPKSVQSLVWFFLFFTVVLTELKREEYCNLFIF